VPHFSPDVNAGVLRQLLGWVEMQHLSPNLGHVHLAQLWVAADLFQVRGSPGHQFPSHSLQLQGPTQRMQYGLPAQHKRTCLNSTRSVPCTAIGSRVWYASS
jgi:hypothetical protein